MHRLKVYISSLLPPPRSRHLLCLRLPRSRRMARPRREPEADESVDERYVNRVLLDYAVDCLPIKIPKLPLALVLDDVDRYFASIVPS